MDERERPDVKRRRDRWQRHQHRIDAPWVFDGPVNGDIFRTYVGHVLVLMLAPGDVLVIDNLRSHRSQAGRQPIHAAGAYLFFPSPCCPDRHPIEQAFAKLKHWMRKTGSRSRDSLW